MGMTANHIAKLTLETWRSSGERTEQRRDALCQHYAESYFGSAATWTEPVVALVSEAHTILRRSTRIDELKYR
jgi:hypothetical protein